MARSLARIAATAVLWLGGALGAAAEPPPPGAGWVDARAHGAKGDGVTDDTDALLAAIAAARRPEGAPWWETRPVYLPAGVYRVSAPLERRDADGRYDSGLVLIGEDRARSVIRLEDGALGYDDVGRPRPVLRTASQLIDDAPNKDWAGLGEGNDAYANYVEDLTIDVGHGNPGAVALDFLANNVGAVRRVRLVAPAGSGHTGLAMTRKWVGPALIEDLEIEGFEIGLDLAHTEYGVTLSGARLSGQRRFGLRNAGNVLAAERLEITGAGVAGLVNARLDGLVTLEGGRIDTATGLGAVVDLGASVLIDVTANGERIDGVRRRGMRIAEPAFGLGPTPPPPALPARFSEPQAATSAAPQVLRLAALDALAFRDGFSDAPWVNVAWFGATGDGVTDDTAAIQAAFDSGAPAVAFAHGRYLITRAIRVPETTRLVDGGFSSLTVSEFRALDFARDEGMLALAPRERPLTVRRLAFDMTDKGEQVAIRPRGPAALHVQDAIAAGVVLVDRPAEGGPLHLDNICCSYLRVAGPAPVWARQLDTEGLKPRIALSGAPMRVLGLKTERPAEIVSIDDGATLEVFGGLVYPLEPRADGPTPAAFRLGRGRLVATYAEEAFEAEAVYGAHVADDAGAPLVGRDELPMRGALIGRMAEQIVVER